MVTRIMWIALSLQTKNIEVIWSQNEINANIHEQCNKWKWNQASTSFTSRHTYILLELLLLWMLSGESCCFTAQPKDGGLVFRYLVCVDTWSNNEEARFFVLLFLLIHYIEIVFPYVKGCEMPVSGNIYLRCQLADIYIWEILERILLSM